MHTHSRTGGRSVRGRRHALLLALAAVAGCAAPADEAPRKPLQAFQAGATTAAEPQPAPSPSASAAAPLQPLPLEAQAALDRGNAAFRAHDYEGALTAYRLAATHAPDQAAPWFGVYLVAQQLGRPALADSALRAVRERSGDQLAGSDVQRVHAGAEPTRQR